MSRSSIATTTANTVRQPRVNVCTAPSPVISVSLRSAAMVANPWSISRPPPPAASARGGASYRSVTTSRPAHSDTAAQAAKTAAGPLAASRTAATAGPPSVASESSMPRTAFALVSCCGEVHNPGSRAECAGRYSDCATVATTARPYVAAAGPSAAVMAAAQPSVAARMNADAGEHPLPAHPVREGREERCQQRRGGHARAGDDAERDKPAVAERHDAERHHERALGRPHQPERGLGAAERPAGRTLSQRARPVADPRRVTTQHGATIAERAAAQAAVAAVAASARASRSAAVAGGSGGSP